MDVRSRIASLRERRDDAFLAYKDRSRIVRVFRHRDFRLLWIGAFVSFIGSWVQNVAQGYLVFQITGSNKLLGLVSFFGMVPVTFLGPIAGTLTDTLNRRRLLVITQSLFAAGALFLAIATNYHFVKYWHIVAVALALGCVSAVEMPTRQSIVSAVVPPEDLPVAIPINALTFNLSRLVGPAVGVFLLTTIGTASCYFVNAVSFFALIFAGLSIRADLRATKKSPEPIRDLIVEGALYTMRDRRLRTLFILESIVSVFGLFYI
jgi:MFS family permease